MAPLLFYFIYSTFKKNHRWGLGDSSMAKMPAWQGPAKKKKPKKNAKNVSIVTS